MELLISALLEWLDSNSEYPASSVAPPAVIQLSAAELTKEFYSGTETPPAERDAQQRVNGLYSPSDGVHGTIYILDASQVPGAHQFEDPTDNPVFQEILLHELVHHVQWSQNAHQEWPCPQIGEFDAYRLGGKFLWEQKTADPLPHRLQWARWIARCP